jgi:hypothetical protein
MLLTRKLLFALKNVVGAYVKHLLQDLVEALGRNDLWTIHPVPQRLLFPSTAEDRREGSPEPGEEGLDSHPQKPSGQQD